jgi:hypothetical protein
MVQLHWWTTDAVLEAAVTEFGPVTSCRFVEERATGGCRRHVDWLQLLFAEVESICELWSIGDVLAHVSAAVTRHITACSHGVWPRHQLPLRGRACNR